MKIIFLNIWQGNYWDKLRNFIRNQSDSTNAFCFQEVSPENFQRIQNLLPEFGGYHACRDKPRYDGLWYSQATFVKQDVKVLCSDNITIFKKHKNKLGFMLCEKLGVDDQILWIGNIHGISKPGNKFDTKIRLKQSQIITDFFKDKGPVIFGGDFNLLPETKSVKEFENLSYKNLIREFKIKATRNKLSWENLKKGEEKQYYADYVFTSPEVKVKSFEVPDVEISDHLPMILDFDIQA